MSSCGKTARRVLVGHSYAGWSLPAWPTVCPIASGAWFMWTPCCPKTRKCGHHHFAKIEKPVKDGFVTCPGRGQPAAAARRLMPAKTFSEPFVDQPGCRPKTARDLHPYRGQGQPAGAGRFLFRSTCAPGPGWTVYIMEGGHNVQRSHPKELVVLAEHVP